MKKCLFAAICLTVLFFDSGCSKDPLKNLSEEESRIYTTRHDESVDFNMYKTFSIVDSVAVIENNRLRRRALGTTDTAYLNAMRQKMQERGYAEVQRDASPDLVIHISRVYNSNSRAFSYADYLEYYPGYYDPSYWGYPGYRYIFPNYYGVYEISEGAFSIDIFDLLNAGNNNTRDIQGIWNGLIRGSGVFRDAKANTAVKILFDQSTYLHREN